jgi:hypothetical protein
MKLMHQLKLGLALVSGLLAALPLRAEILLSHARIVDVTSSEFSVVWHADQASVPSIQIFEDQAGTIEVTSDFEVSRYPLQGLDPLISSDYDYQQSRQAFIDVMNSQGLMQLRVHGLEPAQTYYIKLHSGNQADTGSWPASGTAAVTMQNENAWVLDARQLIINFSFEDAAGWPVVVSGANASYPVSALIEDGAGPGQAVVNLANLFGNDGVNWTPAGTETLFIEVLKGAGDIATANVNVKLNASFTVASSQVVDFELPFDGSLRMLSPALKVYTTGGPVLLSWTDEAPGFSGVISLYFDTDNLNEDGSLIVTSINEDDDGPQDTYDWDVTAVSDGHYYVYATLSDGDGTISSYAPGRITVDVEGFDGDDDSMSDLWEEHHFGTLSRDGLLDFDNDGRSDAQEYLDGTDPTDKPDRIFSSGFEEDP